MTIRLRTAFFIFLGFLFILFLYIERGILRPFVLAAIFAYIFNPTVTFFSQKIKLPRIVSVIIIYALLISLFAWLGILLTQRITAESDDIRNYVNDLLRTANTQITTLPDWTRPTVYDLLQNFRKSHFFTATSIIPFFPRAISGTIGFLIFFFSGFYFLKDGDRGITRFIRLLPKEFRKDTVMLLGKINAILGGYLRGQLFLVFIVSMLLIIALSIIGVRFHLLLLSFPVLQKLSRSLVLLLRA